MLYLYRCKRKTANMKDQIKLYISEGRERWKGFKSKVLPWVLIALVGGFFIGRGNIQITLSIGDGAAVYASAPADSIQRASIVPGFTVAADAGLIEAAPVETAKPFGFSDFAPVTDSDKLAAAYIRRFANVAQAEAERTNQPASVKLAQALLESGKGESWLAVNANAHFGRKCFAKNCKPDHCVNRTDDTHKDFFIKYGNAWESFRDHSRLLMGERYADCRKIKTVEGWCKCLKRKGYATAPDYPQMLMKLVDKYGLREFDN